MNPQIIVTSRLAFVALVAASLTSAATAAPKGKPAPSPQAGLTEKFKRLDVNGPDGFLTLAELQKGAPDPQKAAGEFKAKDANHDGKLTPKEFGIGGPPKSGGAPKKPKKKKR